MVKQLTSETDYVVLKLTNGDEVIGKMIEDQLRHEAIVCLYGCMYVIFQNESGSERLILYPYAPYARSQITPFHPSQIISIIEVSDVMIEYYTKTFAYYQSVFQKEFNGGLNRAIAHLDEDCPVVQDKDTEEQTDTFYEQLLTKMPTKDKLKN